MIMSKIRSMIRSSTLWRKSGLQAAQAMDARWETKNRLEGDYVWLKVLFKF